MLSANSKGNTLHGFMFVDYDWGGRNCLAATGKYNKSRFVPNREIASGRVFNGFTGRAQNSPPTFTPQRQRASGKALTLIIHFRSVG